MVLLCALAASALAAPAPEVAEARRQQARERRLAALHIALEPERPHRPRLEQLQAALGQGERLWLVEEALVLSANGPTDDAPGAAGLHWSVVTGSLAVLDALPTERPVSVEATAEAWLVRRQLPAAEGAALALGEPRAADPTHPPHFADAPEWLTALRSRRSRLPRARDEALLVGEHRAPAGSVAVVAENATEARLRAKLAGGRRYVHLAAFAVVDGPRSGVLLAPVSDGDGWLSALELAQLPWAGAVVGLTTPVPALGTLSDWSLQGLAEAVLLGGARAVVTPSSPRPDAEVLAFVRELAEQNARGVALDEAVARARGASSPHWLLLGDGRHPVYPGGLPKNAAGFVPVALVGLAGALGVVWARPSARLVLGVVAASLMLWALGAWVPGVESGVRVLLP